MRALFVHAHFDDYEFVASGTFELWRRKLGREFAGKIIVCTDGKAGHHFRTREETGRLRLREQEQSAKIGRYEFELLRGPDGRPFREACLQVTPAFLAALWKAIRDFEPDYLFCPPLPSDNLAGVHNDHITIAEAVRRVAYMINVPHAFTPEYPGQAKGKQEKGKKRPVGSARSRNSSGGAVADESVRLTARPCKVPVILNVYDGYMFGANSFDLAVDVESVFDSICAMTWCHQSQICEWLPWVGRHNMQPPRSVEEWSKMLRRRFETRNRELGIASARVMEVFTVTAWGEVPHSEQIARDFPNVSAEHSNLHALEKRLRRWRGA